MHRDEMTDYEINAAIAEHVGALLYEDEGAFKFVLNGRQYGPPTEDLNAMHEAEKAAFGAIGAAWEKYLDSELPEAVGDDGPVECATASQRAEAFIRAVGKRKE